MTNKFNFDEEEFKQKAAEQVMEKILGGSMLGGLSIKLGGLLGGATQQSMRITNIPARVSTGSQPSRRNRLRPGRKRVESSFKSRIPLPKGEKKSDQPDFEDVKNWVVKELAHLFELKLHNENIDIEDRKTRLLNFIPETLTKEILEKAKQLSKKSGGNDE